MLMTNTTTPSATTTTTGPQRRPEQARFAWELKALGRWKAPTWMPGTVSNLVPKDRRDVVQSIRNERASLLGVGGLRVTRDSY